MLEGRGAELIDDLAQRMEEAAQQLEFERAARLRDQINGIKAIHSTQSVTRNVTEDIDAVALGFARRRSLRLDRVRARRPQPRQHELLSARRAWRRQASCSRASSRSTTWAATRPARSSSVSRSRTRTCSKPRLSERLERTVRIRSGVRGVRARWLEMARTNAELGLNMRRATEATTAEQLQSVAEVFGLSAPPKRMECFDVSHTMGERTVASCVVFGAGGAAQERLPPLQYRRPRARRRLRRACARRCRDAMRGSRRARRRCPTCC